MRSIARVVRLPLGLIPKNAVLPILSGPSRGMRWVVGSSDHGCWLGSYERQAVAAFVSFVRPGSVVYDIGANVGYFTLAACAAGAALVVAVEPLADNASLLFEHVRLNGLQSRVNIVEAAAADVDGWGLWSGTGSQGHLASDGHLRVRTVRLDEHGLPTPDLVKIDVEGAAGLVLGGMTKHFEHNRPPLIVELHSALESEAVRAVATSLGYVATGTSGGAVIYRLP